MEVVSRTFANDEVGPEVCSHVLVSLGARPWALPRRLRALQFSVLRLALDTDERLPCLVDPAFFVKGYYRSSTPNRCSSSKK